MSTSSPTSVMEKINIPMRVQLSRAKGWRMPPNTVKVDRTTKWGNPFIVGKHDTQERCALHFSRLLAGWICLSEGPGVSPQAAYRAMAAKDYRELRGKNLACWCRKGTPCHADTLLKFVNAEHLPVLMLPLKALYFDQIKAGTKSEEYRLCTPYWRKRLEGKVFSHIVLTKGYPAAGDTERRLTLPWHGYTVKTICHEFFGPEPVEVFAIKVSP